MKLKRILGGCAWVILALMLFIVNATAGSADEILAQPVQASVSSTAN